MRTCKSVRFPPYSRVKKRRHGPFGGKRTILFVRGSGGTQCAERVRLAEGDIYVIKGLRLRLRLDIYERGTHVRDPKTKLL